MAQVSGLKPVACVAHSAGLRPGGRSEVRRTCPLEPEEPRTGAALPSGVQMGKRSAQLEGILSQLPALEEPNRAEVLSAFKHFLRIRRTKAWKEKDIVLNRITNQWPS